MTWIGVTASTASSDTSARFSPITVMVTAEPWLRFQAMAAITPITARQVKIGGSTATSWFQVSFMSAIA